MADVITRKAPEAGVDVFTDDQGVVRRVTVRGLAARQDLMESRLKTLIEDNGMNGERPLVRVTAEKVDRMEPIVSKLEPVAEAAADLAEMARDHREAARLARAEKMVAEENARRRERSRVHRAVRVIRAHAFWWAPFIAAGVGLQLASWLPKPHWWPW